MKMNYSFGLRPEKRKDILKDFVLLGPLTKGVPIEDRLSVRNMMTPVRTQWDGSCAGEAMGAGVDEFLQKRDYKKTILLSVRWVYTLARDRGGYPEGATLSDVCWVAYTLGIPEEKYFPDVKGDNTSKPIPVIDGETVEDNALKYRIKSYAKIPDLDRLLIAMNDPLVRVVLIGINVYKGMVESPCTETGIVPDPTCFQRPQGGHAMTADAYDLKAQIPQYKKPGWIEAKNSWGTKYGDAGYNKFSLAYFKNIISAYVCTDIPKEELEKKTVKVADISILDIKKDRLWIPKV